MMPHNQYPRAQREAIQGRLMIRLQMLGRREYTKIRGKQLGLYIPPDQTHVSASIRHDF
jgi:hypothetical protein